MKRERFGNQLGVRKVVHRLLTEARLMRNQSPLEESGQQPAARRAVS